MATRIWPTVQQAINNAVRTAQPPLVWDPASHVLSRFAFGPTVADRNAINLLGVQSWYTNQLSYAAKYAGYSGNSLVQAAGPLLAMSPAQVTSWLAAQGREFGWDAMDQLSRVTLGLQIWSPAQLYETLVDFFANHLNVANHDAEVWNTRHTFDRDVIRANVTGSFTDMLLASARNPAMLIYLNLAESSKAAINENYGRELLELHTVGLGYSESDVQNAARLLSGRRVDPQQNYWYDTGSHWIGPVTVLGFTHPNSLNTDGEAGGDALLTYLASHPATATRLATKMCIRFVSDNPSSTLINAVAQAYLSSGTKILPMVDTILRSDEFWSSRGAKVRRPAENMIAAVRILNPSVSSMPLALQTLHGEAATIGDVPLDHFSPDGYPDVASAWRSSGTLINLWRQHLYVAMNSWPGFAKFNLASLVDATVATSGAAITSLTRRLTNQTFTATHQSALQSILGEPASTLINVSNLKYQPLLLGALTAVILDGPHHALR
jgi:uncharacterized protein (DUF1800 family)